MTVKEAFAQAFDEAFVMDAAPSGLSSNPGKAGNSNAAKAKGMGSGMAAAAEGAEKSIGPQKSLAEHKQEGCDAEKNGHPERCPYVQRMTKDFESQGMSHEQALQKALSEHGSGSISQVQQGKVDKTPDQVVQAAAQGQQMPQQKGMQPQGQPIQPTPEELEQQAQQIAQNPQLIDQIPSAPLPATKEVPTEVGELPAQTTVQEGILENLTEQAASGNTVAEESLQELKSKVDNGTITSSPQEEKAEAIKKGFEAFGSAIHKAAEQRLKEKGRSIDFRKGGAGANLFKEQYPDYIEVDNGDGTVHFEPTQKEIGGDSGQIGEQAAPVQTITTSDGKSSRNIESDEAMVLAANPEKNEIFQKMVDIEGLVGGLKDDSPEFKDLANQYQSLQRMFFGADGRKETSLQGSQKRMFERVKREFPDLDEKTFLENKELFDELAKLDSQIARIPDLTKGKAAGIKKTLQKRREEIKQAIMNKQRFILPDATAGVTKPSGKPREETPSDSRKPQSPQSTESSTAKNEGGEEEDFIPVIPPAPPPDKEPNAEKPHSSDGGGPRKAGRLSDYLEALDQMHDAQAAYDAVITRMRRDPGGTVEKYREEIEAARKAMEDAESAVAEFEQEDVDIVGDDGNPIDTGADRRHWAEQERASRNASASGGDEPPDGGDDGDGTPPKLCPICSTPLKKDGTCPKQDEPWHKEGKSGPSDSTPLPPPIPPDDGNNGNGGGGGNSTNQPNNPPTTPPSTPSERTPSSQPTQIRTPSDEEFRVGKNKYKVGGTVYTDVSGKGLLHTMISSFMAGLRGEGIITGWDRISGAWDQMKRSEKGEMVRDGIAGALLKNTIAGYAAKEGLSDDARMELAAIQDMVSRAKTPKDNMAAVKQFQSWKEKYAKELGEMDKPKLGEPFKPLPNDYKGGKPPVSILDAPKDFDADKAFGDKVATVLQESLGAQGLPVGDLESISVGPSATTIEFKVDSSFDITAAQSKKVLSALHGALGSPVSKIDWVDGKPHVIAVQVTNQKMRDVSFSACIASDEWNDFADKAALPVTLGKDSSGKNVNLDLAKQPHTIVTGESGSGKSVFLMAAINSLEMAKTPDEARLVLLDPKNEFRSQDGSPHLLYPRAQKPQDIANVVSSLKALMDDRIAKIGGVVKDFDPTKNEFQGNSDRNITEYNKLHPEEKMPHILMTFDEVASIMKNPDVSDRVKQDLSQIMALGRSVGINCLLATQRADVASIPGDIKANAPASIAFKAAPDDAKASAAAKSLAGSGDFIMTDKEGKQTRGRGCFISDKEIAAVPAYYRDNMTGAPKPADGEGEADGGEGPQLPQEHLDVISSAVEKGRSVSLVATEGYMDAFKNAFPSDWEITEEEIDGEKHWKASPPSKPTGGTEGSQSKPKFKEGYKTVPPPAGSPEYTALIKDAEGKTVGGIHVDGSRIDFTKNGTRLEDGEKAPWEADDTSTPEGSGEPQPTEEPKEENTDWRKDGSRDEAISTLSKVRDAAKAKAWDTYNQGEDTADAQKKLQKALEKADSDFNTKMALVDMKFPPPVDESMDGDSPEQGEEGEPQSQDGNSDDDEDSPAATMKDIEETFNAERERIEKALAKPNTKVRDKQKLREQRKALKQRFKEAKEKFEAGGSAEDMLNIFEPEDKPADKGGTEPQEQQQQSEQPDDEKAAQAQQEQAQKDEKLKASVRPQKFYNSPGFKATQKVAPQQVKQMENLLPAGWEFVTDNQFNAPARTQNGVVFIHNPQNGSYGRIIIKKDAKGKDIIPSEAQIDVDTTHPDYQGFVKNEDGTYGLTEEGKKVEAEYKHVRKYSKNEKELEEVQKKFNRIRFGHDEAPDNMTIVANAVANVLERMEMRT